MLQALGKLNPQAAFMKGKLKIKGNIMLTQKLKSVISAESKLWSGQCLTSGVGSNGRYRIIGFFLYTEYIPGIVLYLNCLIFQFGLMCGQYYFRICLQIDSFKRFIFFVSVWNEQTLICSFWDLFLPSDSVIL